MRQLTDFKSPGLPFRHPGLGRATSLISNGLRKKMYFSGYAFLMDCATFSATFRATGTKIT